MRPYRLKGEYILTRILGDDGVTFLDVLEGGGIVFVVEGEERAMTWTKVRHARCLSSKAYGWIDSTTIEPL